MSTFQNDKNRVFDPYSISNRKLHTMTGFCPIYYDHDSYVLIVKRFTNENVGPICETTLILSLRLKAL